MQNNQIELKGVSKSFGPVRANEGVTLSVRKGSIHAIVGENGAGKSTAMKMLYGQYQPDSGEIWVAGALRHWRSPADAIAAGVGMVHQHFMLAETHGALDNVILGQQHLPFGRLGRAEARAKLLSLMKEYGLEVSLDIPVGELPVGLQQRVEILKLLFQNSDVLILDEPTAVLAPAEIESLFRILKGMAAQGKTILLITHKLKEVLAVAERATIFRAGRVVADRPLDGLSAKDLANAMVGRELKDTTSELREGTPGENVLFARGLKPKKANSHLKEVSFVLRAGEVVGIAAVEGNGQTELVRTILHPRSQMREGQLEFLGEDIARAHANDLRRRGIALFPEDRLREGMLLNSSLEENYLLGRQRDAEFTQGPFLRRGRIAAAVRAALEEFDVRPRLPEALAGSLSGGNQQKLVVARELRHQPKLLIAAQPTRGVDVGAIEMIHRRIMNARNAGAGVLLISSELDEVLKLSDRVLVLFRGSVAGSFERKDFDEKKIGALMAGFQEEK
jgi:ABC-type uncharacterized transport system ATPase subunit